MSNQSEQVLKGLKAQWKAEVVKQYKREPDKVKNSDIDKNTNDIFNNPRAASWIRKAGITRENIFRVLSEIKHEVVEENKQTTDNDISNVPIYSNEVIEVELERRVSCNKCPIYSSCRTEKYHAIAKNCPLVRLIYTQGVNI